MCIPSRSLISLILGATDGVSFSGKGSTDLSEAAVATVADAALEDEVVSLVGPHVGVVLGGEIRLD